MSEKEKDFGEILEQKLQKKEQKTSKTAIILDNLSKIISARENKKSWAFIAKAFQDSGVDVSANYLMQTISKYNKNKEPTMKFLNKNLDRMNFDVNHDFFFIFDVDFYKKEYSFDIIRNIHHYTNHNIVENQADGYNHISNYQAVFNIFNRRDYIDAKIIEELAEEIKPELEKLRKSYWNYEITHSHLNDFEGFIEGCLNELDYKYEYRGEYNYLINNFLEAIYKENDYFSPSEFIEEEGLSSYEEVKRDVLDRIQSTFDAKIEICIEKGTEKEKEEYKKVLNNLETIFKDEIEEITESVLDSIESYYENEDDDDIRARVDKILKEWEDDSSDTNPAM